jgi:hypothetical protein
LEFITNYGTDKLVNKTELNKPEKHNTNTRSVRGKETIR